MFAKRNLKRAGFLGIFYLMSLISLLFLNQFLLMADTTPAPIRLKWYEDHQVLKNQSVFKNLKWHFVGPVWMSGRITDIEVPCDKKYTIYVATASGGVWKTVNQGTTWEAIFQHAPATTIGDLAISESQPDIVWVGTGENNSSRSCYAGSGVYKSTDGGKTWKHMGLADSHHIGRIVIDPENPDIVFVAALGHLYSYNRQRGIYLTLNGGETWEELLFIDEKTGFIDLVMDPDNSKILYAASWQRLRKAWNMWETGPGSGIYKTEDRGKTWRKLTKGLPPAGEIGRIGLGISPSNPGIIYALIDNHNAQRSPEKDERDVYGLRLKKVIIGAEVYRSNDQGETWSKVNQQPLDELYNTYGYYFGEIRVDPKNENTVYLLGVPLLKSTDGGQKYQTLDYRQFHADHQAMWIDPDNTDHIIDGNDGGINISYDGGQTWKDIENLPVVQFYNVSYDMATPFNIYGSAQDHGCFMGPVSHRPTLHSDWQWQGIPGGEASYIAVDPVDADILYCERYYGGLMRYNRKTKKISHIRPKNKKGEPPLRCTWLTPFMISPHNPFTIYFGSQYLFRSLNRGDNWQQISPDLTKNVPEKRGDVPFGTITTISESPLVPGLIYVGTDDGQVQSTRNGGTSWTLTTKGLPENKWVSRIIASAFAESRVYVSLNGYRDDDFKVFLFKSEDYGQTWQDMKNNLTSGPVNVITEDPSKEDILYVGTDQGVYVSLNKGEKWISLSNNLPTTFFHDLIVHPRDNILVAATHGRGMFTLDVAPIQNLDEDIQRKKIHIFPIRAVTIPDNGWASRRPAEIVFLLKKSQSVKVAIVNAKNEIIKELVVEGDRGLNTLVWDLTTNSKKENERYAKAGRYTVKISGRSRTTAEQTIDLT